MSACVCVCDREKFAMPLKPRPRENQKCLLHGVCIQNIKKIAVPTKIDKKFAIVEPSHSLSFFILFFRIHNNSRAVFVVAIAVGCMRLCSSIHNKKPHYMTFCFTRSTFPNTIYI